MVIDKPKITLLHKTYTTFSQETMLFTQCLACKNSQSIAISGTSHGPNRALITYYFSTKMTTSLYLHRSQPSKIDIPQKTNILEIASL